jgi:adenylate cyclase
MPTGPSHSRITFGLKLLAALLASVGVVLLLALLVVRQETQRQVELVTDRYATRSREAFRELEDLKQRDLERLGSGFTDSRRTLAAVEAATAEPAAAGPDLDWLIQTVRYELELKRMPHSLVAFTSASADPFLTLRDGEIQNGADPASLRGPAQRIIRDGGDRADVYRALNGELFAVQVRALALDATVVGTVALGVTVDDAEARSLGDVLGVEVCFVLQGECMAGTPAAHANLPAFRQALDRHETSLIRVAGQRWRVLADSLSADRPGEALRIIAIPMDETLAPFARIRRALVLAGFGALSLALLLGLVLSRQLAGPVRDLVAATARVADGNFATRVTIRTRDELGRLGEAFNTMTEGLEQKELYRGVLDKVVSKDVADELLRSDIMLGGETREVTTLFVDISSFTAMTEGMEPQRVVRLVNRIMSRLGEIVESHGGVVDKYLGDGLMALFGAPVNRTDHAARAVRAALRMQETMKELEREQATGETPVRVAVGIHTAPVVAGNIGSSNRLNYTVIGEGVNLAARLCSGAGPGVILVSEATRDVVQDAFAIRSAGARPFKGFSRPLEVFQVTGAGKSGETTEGAARDPLEARADAPMPNADSPTRSDAGGRAQMPLGAPDSVEDVDTGGHASGGGPLSPRRGLVLLLASLAAVSPATARAQGLPTLADLGIRYMSPGGGFQLDLSGRLDIEGYFPQDRPPWLIPETDPFVAGRARLFADLFIGESIYGLLEVRADRGEVPSNAPVDVRIEQVFARIGLPARLQLQAGKFATPIGGYPSRHHGPEDPLIRPPIMYDFPTIIDPSTSPGAVGGFLGWKNDPVRRAAGVPIIWGVPYPWGALLAGAVAGFDFRGGVLSAAPSSRPDMWRFDSDQFGRPSIVAVAGYRFVPELHASFFFSRGSFMDDLRAGSLPAGSEPGDFRQQLLGAELAFARGRASLRAEGYSNQWNVPNVGDNVRDLSYSIESTWKLTAGAFAAARYGAIHYNELSSVGGGAQPWDHDIARLQLGAGYRLVQNSELRAEYLISRTTGTDPRDNLLSVQWWWAF